MIINDAYKWLVKHPYWVLAVLVATMFISSGGQKIIFYPPCSMHQWRQSDCMAYGQTYYEKGTGLFAPSTYNLAGIDGRVVSEFPIIYYVGAKICLVTGFHYWVFRLLTFLCYLAGLVFLYKICGLWIKNSLLALFPVLMVASSPFYYYYALNFLPNVPAIALSFAGLYYFLVYERTGERKNIIAATVLIILSTALKPPDGGLTWLAFGGTVILRTIMGDTWKEQGRRVLAIVLSSLLIVACVYAWYRFDNWYNDQNLNHQNLIGIYSIFGIPDSTIHYIINDRLTDLWLTVYHSTYMRWLIGAMSLVYLLRWRALDPLLRLFSLLAIAGTMVYMLLWFQAFADHDYYQLIFVIAPAFICITVLEYYERRVMPLAGNFKRVLVSLVLLMGVLTGIVHNANIQDERYSAKYMSYNMHMFELRPYLEKWGIKKNDVVVCVPDRSPNISLMAIWHQGYTECFSNTLNIEGFRQLGAKYLVISDSSYLHKPSCEPYTTKPVGSYGGINVYDIRQ